MAETKKVAIKLIRSMFGRKKGHQQCVLGLGLRRMHHSIVVDGTPENMGMINKVSYLLEIQEL